MSLKKLLNLSFVLVLLGAFLVQGQTFYVNNQTGNDANSGTSPAQAKKTVASAIIAAPTGSTISVAATGINYTEAAITVAGKNYTFTSTGGTPVFANAALNVGGLANIAVTGVSAANPAVVTTGANHNLLTGDLVYINGTGDANIDGKVWTATVVTATTFSINYNNTGADGAGLMRAAANLTFTGPFQFNGLNLLAGTLTGGNQITISNAQQVFRSEAASIASGQLAFAGIANFVYDNLLAAAGAAITTGLEFPVATGVANNLTTQVTTGALTLQLDQNRTINGTLITAGAFNLGGFTFNIAGSSVGHTIGGNVTNGTLAFAMNGAAQLAGAFTLPNVTATTTTAGIKLLTLTTPTAAQSLTATNEASITSNAIVTINALNNTTDVVVNSGTGVVTLAAATTVHGNVVLNSAGLNANNEGQILFNVAGALTINGNVTNSAGITLAGVAASNAGVIAFPDQIIIINGNVILSGALSGSTVAATNFTMNGEIRFGSTNALVTINGQVANSSTSSATGTTALSTVQTNMRILFAATGGNTVVTGGFANSSSIGNVGATTGTNGTIQFFARAAGTVGTAAIRTGLVTNTSTSTIASNGAIDFFATATGAFFGTSVTQGAAGAGGDITFGDHLLNLSGSIINNRTAAGADITVPAGAATVTHAISGNIENNGAAIISIDLTGNDIVGLTGTLKSTGTGGTTVFPVAGNGAINVGSVDVSAGTVTIPASHNANITITTTFNVSGGTVNFNGAGGVNITCVGFTWTNGALDFLGRAAVSTSGATNQIGGSLTNPTFTNSAVTTLTFTQPFPNVTQAINVGLADPVYPGPLTINNTAVIPAPYVIFQSIDGVTQANLYVTNNVTFNSSGQPGVVDIVRLDRVNLNVGKNGVGGGTGNFQNTSGYETTNGGAVWMSGNASPQTVNAGAGTDAGGSFGDFGIDNDSDGGLANYDNAADVTFANGPNFFVGAFYLAEGEIDPDADATPLTGDDVTFNSPAPYNATIYRTEGVFLNNPPLRATITDRVNVVYYGNDKATSFELQSGGNNNVTVATTNGAQQGQGIVAVAANFTVLGTLTVNAAQTLYTGVFTVTANGDVVVDGYIADDGNTVLTRFWFGGTSNVTGSGLLCSFRVLDGANVTFASPSRLVSNMFGGDGVWGGGNDDLATPDGIILHQTGGAGTASSLTLNFPALAQGQNSHFLSLTTTGDGNETVTLASNVTVGGNITHAGGIIDVSTFTLTHLGNNFQITGGVGGATVNGTTGKLLFNRNVDGANEIQVNGGAAVIGANVDIQLNGVGDCDLTTNPLTINGDLNLLDGPTAGLGTNLALAQNLTCGGANVTVSANSQVTGAGFLILDAVNSTPGLTFNLAAAGNANVTNLQIDDNTTLSGGILGQDLIVGTAFVHNAGEFNFGNADLVINGTFTRTGGTYIGSGFLRYNGGAWNHGPAMVINNLDVQAALNIGATANTLTVNDYLRLAAVITQANNTSQLVIGDAAGVTVEVAGGGNVSNAANQSAPTFGSANNTDYLFTGGASGPNTFTWPQNQANNVTLNLGAAANTVTIATGNNKVISGTLTLTTGVLGWDAGTDISMPTAGQKIIRNVNGSLNNNVGLAVGTGTFTAPDINIDYTGFTAGPLVYNTGLEYSAPVIVRDVTLLAMVAPNQTMVQLNSARTISGAVTLNSVLNIGANTTFALDQTIAGTGTVIINAGAITATYQGNLVNNGAIVNNGGTLTVVGSLTGTGTYTGASVAALTPDAINAAGYNVTGLTTLGIFSTMTFTGDATFAGLTLPTAAAVNVAGNPIPTISTNSNLTFTAVFTNTYVNLTFTGNAAQGIALGANQTIQNLALMKTADEIVTLSGGNLTLNTAVAAVAPAPGIPAGLLTLTRGILVVGNIAAGPPAVPALLTIQATVAGAAPPFIIATSGYVRNPANNTDKAHVSGRLGVFVPAGTIGRTEWPVGVGATNGDYRPAALTFTNNNPTIAATTIIVNHQDGEPTGDKNLPIGDIGKKFLEPDVDLLIGSKAPYYWAFEATTSLGSSQKFDLELQGTNLNKPLDTHNDLRIIRRFDGDVSVNGWFVEGDLDGYSNQMVTTPPNPDTTLIVRNRNSIGSAVAQRAFMTIGVPIDAITYNITGTVTYDNVAVDPFDQATVQLRQGATVVQTTATDAAGAFAFNNIAPGSYQVTATFGGPWPTSGVNATDAQMISQHYNGIVTLTGLAATASDVNLASGINNTDALLVVKRWAGAGVTSFAAGDWVFSTVNVTIVNTDAAGASVKGLAVGDANKSSAPTALPKSANIDLSSADVLQVAPNKEFQLPIRVASDMNIGAVSMSFNYPAELVELVSVKGAQDGVMYFNNNGEVRVAWADMSGGAQSMKMKEGDALLMLTFKPTEKFTEGTSFSIEASGENEIATAEGIVINKAGLKAATVESFVPKVFALEQNYPNPFNPSTVIEYALPAKAKVTMTIFNILGQEVTRLIDTEQDAGIYKINWNASGLASGVYIYNINVETPTKNYTDSKRMMLLK